MRTLFVMLLLVLCLGGRSTSAQTFYNPTLLEFESPSHAEAVLYRAEFFVAGTVTTPIAQADVPAAKVIAGVDGKYSLLMRDVPVFLPFGKNYVLRLVVCTDTMCSAPSEVTRELVRYTYCKSGPNSVRPITIATSAIPTVDRNTYAPVSLLVMSVQPVHAVNIQLVGSGLPAFYFTGDDLRTNTTYSVGPLTRPGRYLVNVTAADEAGCSTSTAAQFLTVR